MLDYSATLISHLRATLGKMEVALGAIADSIVWTDSSGRIQWSNATFDCLVARQRFDILGANLLDLLPLEQHGQQIPLAAHPLIKVLQGQQGTNTYEFKQADKKLVLEISSACIEFKGQETSAVFVLHDVTERQRTEEILAKSEAKFRSLIQNSSDLIVILEPDGTMQYVSPSHERILGYKPSQLTGKNAFEFIHPEDIKSAFKVFTKSLRDASAFLTVEFRFQHQDGSWRFLESTTNNLLADPSVGAIVINTRDITERKRVEEQLLHNAFHDSLTNLPNRALFMDRLGCAVEQAKRHKNYLFAVLFIDLDRFKVINDSLGHAFGDQLLVGIANRLKVCLRPIDTFARLGGDEFTILLEDIKDISDAVRIADRIQTQLRLHFDIEGQEVFTTASIGIALSTTNYQQPQEMLRDADIAMYRAKALGKARYEVFNLGMHTRAVAILQLETDLRLAIERREFQIHYQPIVCLKTSKITGFEALLRWQHPVRGLISPGEFIPVAEETGLIVPIGHWVLKEACRQICIWQEQFPDLPPLTVSVNVSGKQFSQPNLIPQIRKILQETNLKPQSLRLEITESILIENTDVVSILLELKAMNIQLYMDDFGTGYSSLSYLHRFPVDTLKIDRSFISTMDTDRKNSGIVQTIIMLAHNLGMNVIAEGIETADQPVKLKNLGCEYGQGYFFSKPLVAEAAELLIAKHYVCPGLVVDNCVEKCKCELVVDMPENYRTGKMPTPQ